MSDKDITVKENMKIEDLIQEAFERGKQLQIEYMDDNDEITKRKVDIQKIDGTKIKAYCHLDKAVKKFDLYKIKKAKIIGKMANFQISLF